MLCMALYADISIYVVPEIYGMVCGHILVRSITIRREKYTLEYLSSGVTAVSPELFGDCLTLSKGNKERTRRP